MPNVYVQRAACKLSRELLAANHSSSQSDGGATTSGGSGDGGSSREVEDVKKNNGEGGGAAEEFTKDTGGDAHAGGGGGGGGGGGEGGGGGGGDPPPPKGEPSGAAGDGEAQVEAEAKAPPHLRDAAIEVLPLTHSPNFRVQMEALMLMDELAKYPGGKEVIAECNETLGYPPEE